MRSFFNRTKGLWRLLVIVFTLVFVFAFTVGAILEANKAQVNRQLGTTTSTVVADGDAEMYTLYTPSFGTSTALVNEHVEVGTLLGSEGSVLLQNTDGALPLSKSDKISLFGYAGTSHGYYGMTVGGSVDSSQNVTLYDALKDRGANVNSTLNDFNEGASTTGGGMWGFQFNGTTAEYTYSPSEIVYLESYDSSNPPASTVSQTYVRTLVGDYSDVGIVVVGRQSSEAADYFPGTLGISASTGARNVFALTDTELEMIDAAKATCGKTIVLLDTSNPMELGPIMEGGDHEVDSILWVGFPGNYGYYGVADVLLGNANPSGRMADTYAYDTTSSPAMQNFGLYEFSNSSSIDDDYRGDYYLVEAEGIYTGYKYYETRYEDSVLGQGNATSSEGAFDSASGWNYAEEVAYSFGAGLSYTTFSQKITGVTFSSDYRTATVNVQVENTGSVTGRSVVQVYGQSPYTDYDKANGVEKASVQLLDYAKTGDIKPGDTDYLAIDIDMENLASYDTDGKGTYIMEAGDYYFALGCNPSGEGAHAALNNILAAKGKGIADGMDAEGDTNAVYGFQWNAADEDIFSVSKAGVSVVNQLSDADLNSSRWNCSTTVNYLSRQDWTWGNSWNEDAWSATNRKGYTGVTATSAMTAQLANYTYEIHTDDDVSGILFDQDNDLQFSDMVDEDGNVIPYDDEKWDLLMDEINLQEAITFIAQGNREYSELSTIGFLGGTLTENGPTGIDGSIPSTSEAPWFDANDPNTGYSWNDMGCAVLQASTFDKDLLERMGEMWGNDSLYVDIPILWAPSINTHRSPYNGRTAEYYSEDPVLSGYSAAVIGGGAEEFGLIVCIKHFAFNDQETNRNGVAPFFNEQKARENELRGFQIAFEGGVKATMTAFNRVGCTYSSAHSGLISGILRGEWGFTGYAISDMINPATYMTFTEAVIAGTSSFDSTSIENDWGGNNATRMAQLYQNDADMLQAIKDAVHEDLWTFAHSNMMNYSNGQVKWVSNWWRATYITLEVVGGVVAVVGLVLYVISAVVGKKDDDEDGKEA